MEQTSAARFSREESMRLNREMTQLRREQTVAAQTLGKANKEKNKKEFIIQRQKSELIALKQAVILLSNKDILYNSHVKKNGTEKKPHLCSHLHNF